MLQQGESERRVASAPSTRKAGDEHFPSFLGYREEIFRNLPVAVSLDHAATLQMNDLHRKHSHHPLPPTKRISHLH